MIRFRFVQDNQADLPIKRMCELVELPRSSFYAWLTRTPSARDVADAELLETIADIYRRSRHTYGCPGCSASYVVVASVSGVAVSPV